MSKNNSLNRKKVSVGGGFPHKFRRGEKRGYEIPKEVYGFRHFSRQIGPRVKSLRRHAEKVNEE